MLGKLQKAGGDLASHVQRSRDSSKENVECKLKRKREYAAAPGMLSASDLNWPYQWADGRRPPHPKAMATPNASLPSGYNAAVHAMMDLSASVIVVASKKQAIKTFHGYALPIFNWARQECKRNVHLFTQLVNDAFVNLTVSRKTGNPQMYYDCGDIMATIMNAHAYDTGQDKVNHARFNCVSASHFVLLGHLYWRERGWSATRGVAAVFYQMHITIRHPTSPEFYENTMGIHLKAREYGKQIDSTMVRTPNVTLELSRYSDLICSHRINALELCRDTRMRGCSVGEAQAWNTCAKQARIPDSKCKSTTTHFMCAYESMFNDLDALSDMIQIITHNRALRIGFPVVFRRLAIWLAIHQLKPTKRSSPPSPSVQDIGGLVMTLWKTFDPSPETETATISEKSIRGTFTNVGGGRGELINETMSEIQFVRTMTKILNP